MSNVRALAANRTSPRSRRWPSTLRPANRSWFATKAHCLARPAMRSPRYPSTAARASSKMQGPRGLRKFRFLVKPNRKVLSELARTEVQTQCKRTSVRHREPVASSGKFGCCRHRVRGVHNQRPNSAVKRTSNGGAQWRAPSRSVAPLAAGYLYVRRHTHTA